MDYKLQYNWHKYDAIERGIPFLLDYNTWLQIWIDSGHLHERGHNKGQYVMARFGDKGPYAVGNVKIITCSENVSEGQLHKPKSNSTKQKMRKPKQIAHQKKLAECCRRLGKLHRRFSDAEEVEIVKCYIPRKKGHTIRDVAAMFHTTEQVVWGALQRAKRVV